METTKELSYLQEKLSDNTLRQGFFGKVPVTTDDILLYMKSNGNDIKFNVKLHLSVVEGYILITYKNLKGYIHKIYWQLGKDLSGQTPETIHELFTFVKEIEEGNN